MNKTEIRKQIKALKQQYSFQQKKKLSASVLQKVEQTSLFQSAKIILLYWSMADEVHTHQFINKWYKSKQILLPSIKGDQLILKPFQGEENLISGEQFAIPEPNTAEFTELDKIDLIIVPGVAFDKNDNRMGRGRGFYDKLLKTTLCPKIGICFHFQLLEHIPTEPHDIPMSITVY